LWVAGCMSIKTLFSIINTEMGKAEKLYRQLKKQGLTAEEEAMILRELNSPEGRKNAVPFHGKVLPNLYNQHDLQILQAIRPLAPSVYAALKTIDELLEHDRQREKDGFPRRIKIGKIIKPSQGDKSKVVVVPSTEEAKFYHDDSISEDGEAGDVGGSGEGEEGEVIGEQSVQPIPGEGEGQGSGEGSGADHDIGTEAFDLGRILTEKFQLPNIQDKGKKRSLTKYKYDLTDKNKGFGQVLDKKATLKKMLETNILLGNVDPEKDFNPEDLVLSPQDHIYKILSQEKDFENQCMVFFLRDYSGSMSGKPTEAVCTQHLLIYSWLMYQYQSNVETRFILHDTEAKTVDDFYTYYKSQVAGGTKVAPAFKLVNEIIQEEHLQIDYNIYVFYGTDGDDWDSEGKELIGEVETLLKYANRVGVSVAKNAWSSQDKETNVERNLNKSGLLIEKKDRIKMDGFSAATVTEERLIEGIRKLIGE
jgi:uncharacterized protein